MNLIDHWMFSKQMTMNGFTYTKIMGNFSKNLSKNYGYSTVFQNYRPGRLDVKVEFKQSRREDVAAILKNFYGDLRDDQEILLKDLPDRVFTPAEVTQILLGNMDSPEHAIEELCQGLHDKA